RDSVSKPRVGAKRLPWVRVHLRSQPQRGCVSQGMHEDATLSGLEMSTTLTQGSSFLATPGLCCGIPLGFGEDIPLRLVGNDQVNAALRWAFDCGPPANNGVTFAVGTTTVWRTS